MKADGLYFTSNVINGSNRATWQPAPKCKDLIATDGI